MEIRILQVLPISLILFLIYISEVFSKVKEKLPNVIYVSFVNNLRFKIFDYSINKVAILVEKLGVIALE